MPVMIELINKLRLVIFFKDSRRNYRKDKKILILLIIFFCSITNSFSQVDTAFWFAAPAITSGHANQPIVFRFSTYAQPAIITITEPANPSFSPITFQLSGNSATTINVSNQINIIENKPGNTVLNYGLKITSTANISVYYEEEGIANSGSSVNPEIFPLKGQIGKGISFLIPTQTRFNNYQPLSPPANNGFAIVATEDNTIIKIKLTDNDAAGHTSADTFQITLNKGQTYAVNAASNLSNHHLGGSSIVTNKPVCVTIYDDSILVNTSWDLAGDQIVPEINTGSEFIIVRGALNSSPFFNQDFYYIWPTVDATDIFVNGSKVATVNRGQSYEGTLSGSSAYITTSNPCYVLQFTGVGTEVAETSLPSIKCTGSQSVSFVRSTPEAFYLNILCKAGDEGNFSLNGNANIITASMFNNVAGTNGAWKAARIDVTNLFNIDALVPSGIATLVTNSSGLFHLGFLNGGSLTGARLGYFSNYSKVQLSPFILSATTCFASDIQLSSTYVNGVTYQWQGPNGFTSTIYNPVIHNAALIDSGKYFVTATIPGCAMSTDSVDVTIHPLPTISFIKSLDTVCYGGTKNINYKLTGTSPWSLTYNFGTNDWVIPHIIQYDTFFVASPVVSTTFSNSIYTVTGITDSNSCTTTASSIIQKDTLIVNKLPVANFGFSNIRCEKNAVTFYDSSKANLDSLVNWYWIMGNGDVKNISDKNSFTEIYSPWGNYPVKLAVQSSMGCKSDTTTKTITIHPLPTVGLILPEVCLNDASALFTDSTKMADGSQLKSWQWNFDASTASPIVPLNKYPSPLTSTQQNPSIHYNLSSHYKVQEIVTSQDGCVDSLTSNFTVNGAKPHAAYVVLDSLKLCSNRFVQLQNFSTVDFGNVTKTETYWTPLIDSVDDNPDSGKVYKNLYPSFTSPATKKYTVKMIARSGNASVCADSLTTIITLHQSPKVAFDILPGICNDTTARQITQAKEIGNVPGSFAYYGKSVDTLTGIFSPRSIAAGTYPIKYVYTTAIGCSDSAIQNQIVWPSPVSKWGVSSPLCEKNNIIFTDSSIANYSNIINRHWNFGDGITDSIIHNNIPFLKKYSSANIYTANLIVETDSGCISKPNIQIINVHYLPKPNFGLPIICLPDGRGQFTDSSTIADASLLNYFWNFGDAADPTPALIPSPTHKFSSLGAYNIKLKLTSKDGCIDSLQKTLTTIYPQPKANFSIQSAEACLGDTIYFFDATTNYTDSIKFWYWNLSQNNLTTVQNPFRQFSDSGTFNISLFIYDAKGCVSDTAIKSVIVDPYPHLNLKHNVFVLQGGSLQLKSVFYAVNPTFNWTPDLYLDSVNNAYPVTTPLNDITYKLTLTGKGNCAVSDTVFVKVLLSPVVPNAFTPNGDGINDTWLIKYLDSYPNCEVQIFDRSGHLIFKSINYNQPWDGTFNGKPLPIGTYYYLINPKNGRAIISGSVTIIK